MFDWGLSRFGIVDFGFWIDEGKGIDNISSDSQL